MASTQIVGANNKFVHLRQMMKSKLAIQYSGCFAEREWRSVCQHIYDSIWNSDVIFSRSPFKLMHFFNIHLLFGQPNSIHNSPIWKNDCAWGILCHGSLAGMSRWNRTMRSSISYLILSHLRPGFFSVVSAHWRYRRCRWQRPTTSITRERHGKSACCRCSRASAGIARLCWASDRPHFDWNTTIFNLDKYYNT